MSCVGNVVLWFYVLMLYSFASSQTVCKGSDTDPCVCDFADGSGKVDLNGAGNTDNSPK